jgi:hypothetical protein
MDDDSAALAIQLLLEDSDEIRSSSKGKGREGELLDAELALSLMKAELELNEMIISDRRMTRSIARAVQLDGNIMTDALSQEQVAASDREVAYRLGGHHTPRTINPWTISAAEMDDELLNKLNALYVSVPVDDDEESGPAPSDEILEISHERSLIASNSDPLRTKTVRCTACQEFKKFYHVARAPCGHEYCQDCLCDLFRSSMTDESLFPPRCCKQQITTALVRIFLTPELVQEYEQKKIEYDTPNRTYCSSPRCVSFTPFQS